MLLFYTSKMVNKWWETSSNKRDQSQYWMLYWLYSIKPIKIVTKLRNWQTLKLT